MQINSNTRFFLKLVLIELAMLAIGFAAGYVFRGQSIYTQSRHAGFIEGQQDMTRAIANCTIADAHAEKCFIPCATNADCLQKNGQTDH